MPYLEMMLADTTKHIKSSADSTTPTMTIFNFAAANNINANE